MTRMIAFAAANSFENYKIKVNKTIFEQVLWSSTNVTEEAPKSLATDFSPRALESLNSSLWMLHWRTANISNNAKPILNETNFSKGDLDANR